MLTSTSIKKRFDRISGDPFSLSRPISLLLTGIVVGAIVGLDPYLATFVSEESWSLILLYDFPYKVSLATAVFLCITGVLIAWAARAREYREIQIVAILISMQLVAIGSGGLDPSDLLVAASMGLIIAYALANPTNPIQFPLVMYFALAIGILDLPHVLIDKPVHFMIGLIKYSKSAILPLIIVHILTSERLVRVFVKTLVAVAFISACIGILQVIIFAYSGIQFRTAYITDVSVDCFAIFYLFHHQSQLHPSHYLFRGRCRHDHHGYLFDLELRRYYRSVHYCGTVSLLCLAQQIHPLSSRSPHDSCFFVCHRLDQRNF
jgi:hypothetical protein